MKKAILATKVGMTQIFNEDGQLIPVTVLQAGPCVVTQVKTEENDGYEAVQVGFGDIRESLVNKPVIPMLIDMGFKEENIKISFRKKFTLQDLKGFISNGLSDKTTIEKKNAPNQASK